MISMSSRPARYTRGVLLTRAARETGSQNKTTNTHKPNNGKELEVNNLWSFNCFPHTFLVVLPRVLRLSLRRPQGSHGDENLEH